MSGLPEPGGASVRRDNGLSAGAWEPLAWIDAADADAALAALAAAGVPALVESPPGSAAPAVPPPVEPGSAPAGPRPEGRLLLRVDTGRRDEARSVLTRDLPGSAALLDEGAPGGGASAGTAGDTAAATSTPEQAGPRAGGQPLDEDAAWAQIVAGWERDEGGGQGRQRPGGALPVPPWPVSEDLPERQQPPSRDVDAPGPSPAVRSAGPRDHSPADDPADEHYVPPPPPPLPRLRRGTVGALAALALGVVLLFAPGLIGLRGGDGVAITGIAAIVGSVVALVYGMRDGGRGTSDDGGAVV